MSNFFFRLGAILASLAVAAGAYASHGLVDHATPEGIDAFRTAVQYHFYHALGLVLTGWLLRERCSRAVQLAGWLFLGGILLFCGSLYLYALSDDRGLLQAAPVGGFSFIIAWLSLAFAPIQLAAARTPQS